MPVPSTTLEARLQVLWCGLCSRWKGAPVKPYYFIAMNLCHDVDTPLHVGQRALARRLGRPLLRSVSINNLRCHPQPRPLGMAFSRGPSHDKEKKKSENDNKKKTPHSLPPHKPR